jgi:exonuclease SbcD
MRFLHTADWHLGRIFHQVHLTEDQAYVLEQVVDAAKEYRPDAVLVAGDVYDRAVPPPEAVELLDDVLSRLVLDVGVPVVLIAGNHDSPSRLAFGSRLLAGRGLHVIGDLAPVPRPLVLFDDAGPAHVVALPYAEPSRVRDRLGEAAAEAHDHDAAMRILTGRIRESLPRDVRAVLVAHAFVAGGTASESERPLSVGGAEEVDPSAFEGFHYVALGHLHRPQTMNTDRIRYSGSLLKYSFSETDHAKSITLVELDGAGACRTERVALTPRRDVRRIEGLLDDLLRGPGPGENPEDYLLVTLLDKGPRLDPMGRLREVYPNALHIERSFGMPEAAGPGAHVDHRGMSDTDLFATFFHEVTGEALSAVERRAFESQVESLRSEDREAPQ